VAIQTLFVFFLFFTYCVYSFLVCFQLKLTNTSHPYRERSTERPAIRNEEDIRLGGPVNRLVASSTTGRIQIKLHE